MEVLVGSCGPNLNRVIQHRIDNRSNCANLPVEYRIDSVLTLEDLLGIGVRVSMRSCDRVPVRKMGHPPEPRNPMPYKLSSTDRSIMKKPTVFDSSFPRIWI